MGEDTEKGYYIRGYAVYIKNKYAKSPEVLNKALGVFRYISNPKQKKIKKDITRRLHDRY